MPNATVAHRRRPSRQAETSASACTGDARRRGLVAGASAVPAASASRIDPDHSTGRRSAVAAAESRRPSAVPVHRSRSVSDPVRRSVRMARARQRPSNSCAQHPVEQIVTRRNGVEHARDTRVRLVDREPAAGSVHVATWPVQLGRAISNPGLQNLAGMKSARSSMVRAMVERRHRRQHHRPASAPQHMLRSCGRLIGARAGTIVSGRVSLSTTSPRVPMRFARQAIAPPQPSVFIEQGTITMPSWHGSRSRLWRRGVAICDGDPRDRFSRLHRTGLEKRHSTDSESGRGVSQFVAQQRRA